MRRGARVMMIGLDGFELSIADRLMGEGRLPALARLKQTGGAVLLDHGDAKRSGLAWEHVSTGLSPDDAERWAAVDFDPDTYAVWQDATCRTPFAADLDFRTVVFDPPYFALDQAKGVEGVVNWGAHDPGVLQAGRPQSLMGELSALFGAYPARDWIYGFVWPSEKRTRAMGKALEEAVVRRTDIAEWLFAERCPRWDLAYMVISEYHSSIEAMWHGVDETHALHGAASAKAAKSGVEAVYEAGDRLLARMMERFADANFVVFNLHGMGANDSDAASMALLPELLYRHAFGERALDAGPDIQDWARQAAGGAAESWDQVIDRALPPALRGPGRLGAAVQGLRNRFPFRPSPGRGIAPLTWMPAARYQRFWKDMPAFALPSFYDGRIRINLRGREARGMVAPEAYEDTCDQIVGLLNGCRDTATGEPVVAEVQRRGRDPFNLADSDCDILVVWRGQPLGFSHPSLGQLGPLPHRRTGGHTGKSGVAYIGGPDVAPSGQGARNAFDVVPTVIEMLGRVPPEKISGESFYAAIRRQEAM